MTRAWQWRYILKDSGEAMKHERSVYNRYRLSWHLVNKVKPRFPLVMMFETSALCNINCVMCPRQSITRDLKGNMRFSFFRQVVDQCKHNPVMPCQMTMHYSGEPLLNPELPKMVSYAKDFGVPFVRFNTNGLLLTEKTSEQILGSKLDKMTVALECTKEIHDKTRLGSNYDKVSENIRKFMELKRKMHVSRPVLWIQMLTSDWTTEQDVIYGIRKWRDVVDYVEVTTIATIGSQVPDMGSVMDKIDCDDAYVMMAVLWNGDVTVCCVDHNAKLKMGNLNRSTVQQLWDSPKWERLRGLHKREAFDLLPQLCRGCVRKLTPWEKARKKVRRFGRKIVREKLKIPRK